MSKNIILKLSQNTPDCILAHIHLKKFLGGTLPQPPWEARGLLTTPHLPELGKGRFCAVDIETKNEIFH